MKNLIQKCSILIVTVFLGNPVFAQTDSTLKKNEENATKAARSTMGLEAISNSQTGGLYSATLMPFDDRYQGVKNSYYMNTSWMRAELYGKSGSLMTSTALVKYDAVNKELVMQKPNNDSAAVYPDRFRIIDDKSGRTYDFITFRSNPESKIQIPNNYVQLIYGGKMKLIKNVSKEFVPANYKDAYSPNITYDIFEDNSQYFLVDENNFVQKIKLSKNAILKILKGKKSEIESFLKSNQFSLDNEFEVASTLKFYEGN